jgi:alkylation response protein AidB-like acyl-CoA dehydrogenase
MEVDMEAREDFAGEFQQIKNLAEQIAKERIAPHATERDMSGEFPWECLRALEEDAIKVSNKAIQVLGGHGYCRDFVVERLFRDARGLTLHFKTSELLRQDIAKAALGL